MQSLDFTSKVSFSVGSEEIASSSNATPGSETRTVCGFQFWFKAQRMPSAVGDILEIYLQSEPEPFCADSYQLLIDYHLMLLEDEGDGNHRSSMKPCAGISVKFEPVKRGYSERLEDERWTLRVEWDEAADQGWVKVSPISGNSGETGQRYSCTVRCQLKIRELLTAHQEDYGQEALPRRDFALLLGHQKQLYVDLQYLADQGSEYFRDLLESKRKGVRRAVIMNTDASDMELFLDAVCTHRKLVVTNRNFDVVLRLAQDFGVAKALRACEAYLIETDGVHPIRKLEYAAEYGLGLLGETVVRQLTDARPLAALDSLHEYLQMNDERLDQMHPDVLYALNVFDKYVVL